MSEKKAHGASLAFPAERQKSRSAAYRRAYHRAHFGTISACLPRPEKEAFREACRRQGKTQHEVIAELVAEWMAEQNAFNYLPEVEFGCQ